MLLNLVTAPRILLPRSPNFASTISTIQSIVSIAPQLLWDTEVCLVFVYSCKSCICMYSFAKSISHVSSIYFVVLEVPIWKTYRNSSDITIYESDICLCPHQNQANARLNLENLSLKKCPKPARQAFRPPAPNGQCPNRACVNFYGSSLRWFCCQLATNAVVATCYPLLPILFTLHILPPGDAITFG